MIAERRGAPCFRRTAASRQAPGFCSCCHAIGESGKRQRSEAEPPWSGVLHLQVRKNWMRYISFGLRGAAAQARRAKENSPGIHPWGTRASAPESPGRDERTPGTCHPSFATPGAWRCLGSRYPPLKRWARIGRPCGTCGAAQARRAEEDSPGIYPWGTRASVPESPGRDERAVCICHASFAPPGAWWGNGP